MNSVTNFCQSNQIRIEFNDQMGNNEFRKKSKKLWQKLALEILIQKIDREKSFYSRLLFKKINKILNFYRLSKNLTGFQKDFKNSLFLQGSFSRGKL